MNEFGIYYDGPHPKETSKPKTLKNPNDVNLEVEVLRHQLHQEAERREKTLKTDVTLNQYQYQYIKNIIEQSTNSEIKDSEKHVGIDEMITFFRFFDLKSGSEFVEKLKDIQKKAGLKKRDGILGPETLRYIYLNYYSHDLKKAGKDAEKRWTIYKELNNGYSELQEKKSNKKRTIGYKNLDVFSMNDYFGSDKGTAKKGTFINENLIGQILENEKFSGNKIIVTKFGKDTILKFYVHGKLYAATYVSPGKQDGHETTSKSGKVGDRGLDKFHFSSTYPKKFTEEGNIDKERSGGAVMPYAINIKGEEWIHGSTDIIDGKPASHGCVRVPLFYMKEIFKKVSELGKNNVIIDTTGIY